MTKKMMQFMTGLCFLLVTQIALADNSGLRYRIFASGAQEVPSVITETTARLDIQFDRGLSESTYRLVVKDGVAINQAHLHCAGAGINGPVVAFLFGLEPSGVDVDGILSQGTLTNLDILGNDCAALIGQPVNNIASLVAAIKNGLIYLNVHAVTNPPGLVRAQFLPQ